MKRLIGYIKPHKWVMAAATLLVLLIIVVELYRPIIIGDAIDDYINGYQTPFAVCGPETSGAVSFRGGWLTRAPHALTDAASDADRIYCLLLLYEDRYYLAQGLSWEECEMLSDASPSLIETCLAENAVLPSRDELRELRRYDFSGILTAGAL